MNVVSCKITKAWDPKLEYGNDEERMAILHKYRNPKEVSVANNPLLNMILPYLLLVKYEDASTYPKFEYQGKWYFIDILNDTTVPRKELALLQSIVTPPSTGMNKRLISRKVVLTFETPFCTR